MRWYKSQREWMQAEHWIVRFNFALVGVATVPVGWLCTLYFGVPAGMPGANQISIEEVARGLPFLLLIVVLCSGPLAIYVLSLRTLVGSVVTGVALVGGIAWAFGFMVTSTSSTAALAIFLPAFYNYGVVFGGWLLDVLVRAFLRTRQDQPADDS